MTVQAISTPLSVDSCVQSCAASGKAIAGVEFGQECYCSDAGGLGIGSSRAAETSCTTSCAGNPSQLCGGARLLSVYSTVPVVVRSAPIQPPAVLNGTWSYTGCYSDSNTRTLSDKAPKLGATNTNAACAQACAGFAYFGTEYGKECYCGKSIQSTGQKQVDSSSCSMPCSGDGGTLCGAGNRLSVYQYNVNATSPSGITSTTTITTSDATPTIPPAGNVTSTSTSSVTSAATTTTDNGSNSTVTSTSTSTSTTDTSTSTTSTSTSTTSTSTSTSSTAASTPTGAAPWTALGCYEDSTTARSLSLLAYKGQANSTVGVCQTACKQRGYRFSGVEYGSECYCDNFMLNRASSIGSKPAKECSSVCAGASNSTCGGPSRIEISRDTTWKQTVFTVQAYRRWNFTDCYTDAAGNRTLGVVMYQGNATSTVEGCLDTCAKRGMNFCAPSYGKECFGSLYAPNATVAPTVAGGVDPLARGCSMPCSGNATEACGGGSRLNIYALLTQSAVATEVVPATVQQIK